MAFLEKKQLNLLRSHLKNCMKPSLLAKQSIPQSSSSTICFSFKNSTLNSLAMTNSTIYIFPRKMARRNLRCLLFIHSPQEKMSKFPKSNLLLVSNDKKNIVREYQRTNNNLVIKEVNESMLSNTSFISAEFSNKNTNQTNLKHIFLLFTSITIFHLSYNY